MLFASISQIYALDDPYEKLLNAKTIKCYLGKGVAAEWEGEKIKIEITKWSDSPERSTLIFNSIKLKEGKAHLIGNQGAGDVTVFATITGITFMERTAFGSINITTIFPIYARNSNKFIFVHSRHLSIMDQAAPSQYYGTCEILE